MLDKGMVLQGTAQRVSVYSAAVEKVGTLAAFARDFSQRVMEMDAPLTAAGRDGVECRRHLQLPRRRPGTQVIDAERA